MLRRLDIRKGESEKLAVSLRRSTIIDNTIIKTVQEIIEDVKNKGDRALFDLTLKFDHVKLKSTGLRVSRERIEHAYKKVTEQQVSALEVVKKRLEDYDSILLKSLGVSYSPILGVNVSLAFRPLNSVGCYVPGGKAAYPSSLLMSVVPARTAGVKRVVVCSPPMPSGEPNPLLLVASDLCNVDEFYCVGGAQAVAAMALGTESISQVSKIVGPGNIYVTVAKMALSHVVAVDLPAGPSEVLVLADKDADPRLIALDLLAQAEHGVSSVCGVITTSTTLAEKVDEELSKAIVTAPRKNIVKDSIASNGFIALAPSQEEAIAFVNSFAPEHLEVFTSEPQNIAEKIISAGLILLGERSSAAVSDYCVGPNHILPTNGYARTYSGLSVFDFGKRISIVSCSKGGLRNISDDVVTLAEAEGLYGHAQAVKERL